MGYLVANINIKPHKVLSKGIFFFIGRNGGAVILIALIVRP